MPRQYQLFPMPSPSSKTIQEFVRNKLYGFKFRQAARDEKRLAQNSKVRKELARERELRKGPAHA